MSNNFICICHSLIITCLAACSSKCEATSVWGNFADIGPIPIRFVRTPSSFIVAGAKARASGQGTAVDSYLAVGRRSEWVTECFTEYVLRNVDYLGFDIYVAAVPRTGARRLVIFHSSTNGVTWEKIVEEEGDFLGFRCIGANTLGLIARDRILELNYKTAEREVVSSSFRIDSMPLDQEGGGMLMTEKVDLGRSRLWMYEDRSFKPLQELNDIVLSARAIAPGYVLAGHWKPGGGDGEPTVEYTLLSSKEKVILYKQTGNIEPRIAVGEHTIVLYSGVYRDSGPIQTLATKFAFGQNLRIEEQCHVLLPDSLGLLSISGDRPFYLDRRGCLREATGLSGSSVK